MDTSKNNSQTFKCVRRKHFYVVLVLVLFVGGAYFISNCTHTFTLGKLTADNFPRTSRYPYNTVFGNVENITRRNKALTATKVPIVDNKNVIFYRKDTTPEETAKLPFLSNYKNPCWREVTNKNNSRVRCLPYFYLIGVTKCGTTDLHARMARHPLVSSKSPKELHWLSVIRFRPTGKNRLRKPDASRTSRSHLSYYLNRFDGAVKELSTRTIDNGYHNMIFGDSTPNTIWETNLYWTPQDKIRPNHTNADVIHHLNPATKIIVLLRNPVTRAYSQYKYTHRNPSPDQFHTMMVNCTSKMKTCLNSHSLRYCIDHWKPVDERRTFVGIYHIFLEDFFKVFPRNQILILKTENMMKHIDLQMKRVFDFLGVGQPTSGTWQTIISSKKINQDRTHVPDMLNKTRQLLQDFHKPYNEKLKQLLGEEFNYNDS